MSSQPVLLILGYGPRTGKFIADKFFQAGYRIAATGRGLKDGLVEDGFLNIKADLADPAVVLEVYKKTQAYFKAAPNVVVYNGENLCAVVQFNVIDTPSISLLRRTSKGRAAFTFPTRTRE
jgi:NAD(P)-dependent dehydrogenase (short-subunit alcohol dehydrogenase family)